MPFLIILLVFGLVILFSSFFTVKQQTLAVIERFGKFNSIRNSGLQLKVPVIDRIAVQSVALPEFILKPMLYFVKKRAAK